MWYEALPAFIIMASCITATGYGMKFLDKLFLEGKVTCLVGRLLIIDQTRFDASMCSDWLCRQEL